MTTLRKEKYERHEKMFYKVYTVVLIVCTVLGFLVLGNPLEVEASTGKHVSKTRKATGQVIDYSPKDSVVYIETSDGNVWMISEADFEIGDIVTVKFDTRNTKKKQDDRILRVYYKGFCDFMVF